VNTPPTGFNNTAPDNFNGLGGGFELPNVNIGNILRSYFQIILKYWWIILLTFVLLMTLATLWAKRIVPEYRATTTIEIKQEDTNILGNNSVSQVDANEEFLLTQISLLKSTKLAKTVAEDLNFLNNPKYIEQTGSREQKLDKASKIVQNKLTITRLGRSRIIAISVEDTNPKMAANIANTLAENFARYDQEH